MAVARRLILGATMNHRCPLFLLCFTITATAGAACKKDDPAQTGGAAPAGDEPAPGAAAETGLFAGWDLAGRRAALQGAHVTPGNSYGTWHAWYVDGDQVTVWDGAQEKTLELSVPSPCEVKVTERTGSGSSWSVTHFTLRKGVPVMGLGDAGSRRGEEAIACVSNRIVTRDASGACTEWKRSGFDDGPYESKPGTCAFVQDGERELFTIALDEYEARLWIDGDALLSEQLARTHSEKVGDYGAAKAARDQK
jgi:hypothetical protein